MYLSNSKLEKWLHSKRCFFWRYCLKVAPDSPKQDERLVWGDVIHKCLELMLSRSMTPNEAVAKVAESGLMDRFVDTLTSGTWRSDARVVQLLGAWYDQWAAEGNKNRFKVLDVEKEFVLPTGLAIPGTDEVVQIQGIIDAVVEEYESGKIFFIDHKTTEKKVDSSYYTDHHQWSNQFTAYDWIGRTVYGDQWGGMLLNAIQSTKTIPHNIAITSMQRSEWQTDEWLNLIATEGAQALAQQAIAERLLESTDEQSRGGIVESLLFDYPHSNDYSENFCEYQALNRVAPDFRMEFINHTMKDYVGREEDV